MPEPRFFRFESEEYPSLLREIPDPPRGFYALGRLPDKDACLFAIVGTRKSTSEGAECARRFSRELAHAGFTIISGLALGIDAAAHKGALDAAGKTVAVLAHGLDSFYPRENGRLAEAILEHGGAIISEYGPGIPAYPSQFLERNRIVSGLSQGILVVEAPEHSGSLATARFALEQNRDVFVVPGPITHPNFKGSNQLIRQGATLITKAEEILEAYGIDIKRISKRAAEKLSAEEIHILSALESNAAPLDVDKIIEITKLEPRVANQTLSRLLIMDYVKETESGYTMN